MKLTKKRYKSATIFVFLSLIITVGTIYLTWRWLYTLNVYTSPFTTFFSYALVIGEILTLLVFIQFGFLVLKANTLKKVEPSNVLQNDYSQDVYFDGKLTDFKNFCPSVDIFICTLNENYDMLSTTIAACKNINYPNHKVYILDDGKRPEIKNLTELLGCNYITRDTNKGFKAGNINNALKQTDGEIVVIFDADHVAASTFLRETVYYFTDEKVAMVQTPQYFCNLDAFQKNLLSFAKLANEQEVFYRMMEPALNEFDSVFCGGTNILIRRKHLENVGNFPENTITEDSLLGLIFHAYKYKIVYYNRPIAIGIAASGFEEYIKQRSRWARGNIQIITNFENWKYYFKLNKTQFFFYIASALYFFTPFARLVYLSAPVLYLFFDISTVMVLFYQIIAFQICYFSLKFAFIFTSKMRVSNVVFADVYDLVTSIFTVGSIFNALILRGRLSKIKFSVTNKNATEDKTKSKYKIPLIIIWIILIIAEMQGIYDLLFSEPYSPLAIIANLFWNTTNIFVLFYGIQAVSEKPEKRFYQRIKTKNELDIKGDKNHNYKTEIEDISRSGVKIVSSIDLKNPKNENLNAQIEGETDALEIVECKQTEDKKFSCKTKFKKPFSIIEISKKYIDRINKFVKLAYKNPDKWDDYYDEDE